MKNIDIDKLLKHSVDMICTINGEGRFVAVSDACLTILGYHPEELTGKLYTDFIHADDLKSSVKALSKTMANNSTLRFQNRYQHKNGSAIPILWSGRWDQEGGLMYCMAKDGEITEQAEKWRQSLEESNQRYNYVTKATVDAIWDWNLEKSTLYWGEGFETIFGYKISEVPPGIAGWLAHIHPEDADWVSKSIFNAIEGDKTNWKEEYRYKRADDSYAHVVDRGFVIRNHQNKAVRMVGAMHDISERKIAVEELKRFADDLYKHNRELHQFGYIVSHNLRSPVANIMGITSLIELEKDDPETVEHCVKDLKTSIYRLDEVIKDLSKILTITDTVAELIIEEMDLLEVLKNVTADLEQRIATDDVIVTIPEKAFLFHSHKAYIYSIFHNLVSNAIKYKSDRQPKINISIGVNDSFVEIKVTDNGIGIDLNRHEADLFKPYKRFHDSKDGKGLGLFLVKSHVEALNGFIFIESVLGEGTSFTILLPSNTASV